MTTRVGFFAFIGLIGGMILGAIFNAAGPGVVIGGVSGVVLALILDRKPGS